MSGVGPIGRSHAVRLSAAAAGCWALLAAGGWVAPAASEVTSTAQARIANAEFLATAVPPGPAAGVCLVDTGVDVNPDTSQVVARLALSGTDASDGDATKHGTSMAMLMGAGRNDFGIVGLFPAVRIVSVRATPAGSGVMNAARYINGIKLCRGGVPGYGLRVIELALSSSGPISSAEAATLASTVASARARGLSVVAAAGNNAGGAVEIPASQPGVLSVGGVDGGGQRCASSASGATLQAPGCGVDEADPVTGQHAAGTSGTSQASAVVATALAALMSWLPDLTPEQAEQALIDSARAAPGGRSIDVAAAFRHMGLGAVVDANQPAAPPPPAPTDAAGPPTVIGGSLGSVAVDPPRLQSRVRSPRARARMPRPRVRLRAIRRYRGVLVSVSNRPRGAAMVVSAYRVDAAGRPHRVADMTRRAARLALRVNGWDELRVRYRDPTRARPDGPVSIIVHPRQRNPA